MKKFEYKTITVENLINAQNEAILDRYGGQGWELVSILYDASLETSIFYFKRERQ